jgi:hypothetical protein
MEKSFSDFSTPHLCGTSTADSLQKKESQRANRAQTKVNER